MAKRPYAEVQNHFAGGSDAKKGRKTGAMEHLVDRADDLIECLQALKRQASNHDKTNDTALTQRLTSLSRDVLPSFQSIAAVDDVVVESATEEPVAPKTPVVPVLTEWSPSEVAHSLPPLPPVLDSSLERASFTHAGAVKDPGARSYEQLEWLGDAYLYLMATAYIYLTFPHLKHGDMAQIREVLVRNATLGGYSSKYGFDKRVNFPGEYYLDVLGTGTKVSAKERDKVLGDVFEAHVAAIILSDPICGVANAAIWMKALWSTTISEQIMTRTWQGKQAPLLAPTMSIASTNQQQTKAPQAEVQKQQNAKDKLSAELALNKPRVIIEYRPLDDGQPHKKDPLTNLRLHAQGVFLVGYGQNVLLGSGKDKRKKEANEKAAENALSNKKLMNVWRGKKQAMLANQHAAQEEALKGLDF